MGACRMSGRVPKTECDGIWLCPLAERREHQIMGILGGNCFWDDATALQRRTEYLMQVPPPKMAVSLSHGQRASFMAIRLPERGFPLVDGTRWAVRVVCIDGTAVGLAHARHPRKMRTLLRSIAILAICRAGSSTDSARHGPGDVVVCDSRGSPISFSELALRIPDRARAGVDSTRLPSHFRCPSRVAPSPASCPPPACSLKIETRPSDWCRPRSIRLEGSEPLLPALPSYLPSHPAGPPSNPPHGVTRSAPTPPYHPMSYSLTSSRGCESPTRPTTVLAAGHIPPPP